MSFWTPWRVPWPPTPTPGGGWRPPGRGPLAHHKGEFTRGKDENLLRWVGNEGMNPGELRKLAGAIGRE